MTITISRAAWDARAKRTGSGLTAGLLGGQLRVRGWHVVVLDDAPADAKTITADAEAEAERQAVQSIVEGRS